MRIFKILATLTFVLSLSSPSFSQSAAAGGASGSAGAAGASAASAGAAGAAEEDESSLPQATTNTISIDTTSKLASILDLRSILILIKFPPNTYPPDCQWICLFYFTELIV